jgi:hypothetical protein
MSDAPTVRLAICQSIFDEPDPLAAVTLQRACYEIGKRGWGLGLFPAYRSVAHVGCNQALQFMEEHERASGIEYTHVVWLDDDVAISAENLFRLIECIDAEHPAVYALAFYRQPPHRPSLYEYRKFNGWDATLRLMTDYPEDQLVRVSAAGLCAAAFSRKIFKLLSKPYFEWHEAGLNRSPVTPDGFIAAKMHEQGIPMFVHTGIGCTHMGGKVRIDAEYARQFKQLWSDVMP